MKMIKMFIYLAAAVAIGVSLGIGETQSTPQTPDAILARCVALENRAASLLKRSTILEQEIRKLDLRIKKQEGLKHGFGY